MDGRRVEIEEVMDRWFAPDHAYFKVRGEDGATYILRYEQAADRWELWMYDKRISCGTNRPRIAGNSGCTTKEAADRRPICKRIPAPSSGEKGSSAAEFARTPHSVGERVPILGLRCRGGRNREKPCLMKTPQTLPRALTSDKLNFVLRTRNIRHE
jgi:hypothetical protein